jgi:mono/diheme cytochrome c family protein
MVRSLFVLVIAAAACGKNNEPPPPSSGSPNAQPESGPSHGHATKDPVAQAQDMFGNVCAMCHGVSGAGDGPAAANLNPKPRNYTDPTWQASVTDDQIRKTILEGGQAVGKSPMMPGQPQLKDQPEVLDNLVKMIRGFGKK